MREREKIPDEREVATRLLQKELRLLVERDAILYDVVTAVPFDLLTNKKML